MRFGDWNLRVDPDVFGEGGIAPVPPRKTDQRITRTGLEFILPRELQRHGLGRNVVRLQQDKIRRGTSGAFAIVGKTGTRPFRNSLFISARVLDFHFQCCVSVLVGGRQTPDVPTGRDVPAFDERAAADESSRRLGRMNVD